MTYGGVALTHTVTGLVAGVRYRFAIKAYNLVGYSDFSYYTLIAAAVLPSAPTLLWKDIAGSNKTAI